MKIFRKLNGDTLIEVSIAVGIFSLVALAVVSVVSISTAGAQSALETTLVREEIDAQAEALRFIQSAYMAGGRANIVGEEMERYAAMWDKIVGMAHDLKNDGLSNDAIKEILNYNPERCSDIYSGNYLKDVVKGFVIDTRQMGKIGSGDYNVVLKTPNNATFQQTATYPRLYYDSSSADPNELVSDNISNSLSSVDGIFIVAVKDASTTNIIAVGGSGSRAAYYDFYIRTCWYNPGADAPSTISTMIRLQDPNVITY